MNDTRIWIVLLLLFLSICSVKHALVTVNLSNRIMVIETILQRARQSTVEIHVERVYDEDMAQWGYKMIALEEEEKGGEDERR